MLEIPVTELSWVWVISSPSLSLSCFSLYSGCRREIESQELQLLPRTAPSSLSTQNYRAGHVLARPGHFIQLSSDHGNQETVRPTPTRPASTPGSDSQLTNNFSLKLPQGDKWVVVGFGVRIINRSLQ